MSGLPGGGSTLAGEGSPAPGPSVRAMTKTRMPGVLWVVLVVLVLQAVVNGFAGFLLQDEIDSRLEHGQEVANSGLVYTLLYLSYTIVVVLLICVVFLALRRSWARYPVYAIEALAIINGLIVLVAGGGIAGLVGMIIAGGVLVMLAQASVGDWLAGNVEGPPPVGWPHTAA